MRMLSIVDALDDENVFAHAFRGNSWRAWRAFFTALFALPISDDELELYRKHTGRTAPLAAPSHETWLVIGRRGGKSFALATIAVYLACFHDWRRHLGPGEVATIMIIARDRRQARVIKCFVSGLLNAVPMLAATIADEQVESIRLRNRVTIEIHTASFRSTRGYTIVAALLDEIAYWPTDLEAAEPDVEVVNALKPGMATVPGAMIFGRLVSARSAWRAVGGVSQAFRQGRRSGSVLAGDDAGDEPERAAIVHRRPHGGGSGLRRGGISRAIPGRSRGLCSSRSGRGLCQRRRL
jgi:hypothetical protein